MDSKDALTKGAVKPWHVIFIVLVSYLASGVAADKIVKSLDPDIGWVVRDPLALSLAAVIIIAYTLVVPEFRRILPVLSRRPRTALRARDMWLALAFCVCWGFGLYRAAVYLPALNLNPGQFNDFGFSESMPEFKARYLIIVAGIALLAPFAEELVFRGFLLNLWIARWGVWKAIIASSLFFGVMHGERMLFAAILGFALALVYLKYDSLWPSIAVHALYNFLGVYWLLGGFFAIKVRATVQDPANWIPEIALAILFFPAAWFFWKRFRPRT